MTLPTASQVITAITAFYTLASLVSVLTPTGSRVNHYASALALDLAKLLNRPQ